MNTRLTLLAILALAGTCGHAEEELGTETVLGPRNVFLYDGANALRSGDGEEGVRLTLQGLKTAQGRREEKIAHANLCAGFLLINRLDDALQHCNWVIDADPHHWRTYNNRAIVYLRLKRFEESEADIRKGQELNPRSEKLKEVKGLYLDEVDPVAEKITIDDRRSPPAPEERPEQ